LNLADPAHASGFAERFSVFADWAWRLPADGQRIDLSKGDSHAYKLQ